MKHLGSALFALAVVGLWVGWVWASLSLGRGAAESDLRVRRSVATRSWASAVNADSLYPATLTGSPQR